MSSVNFVALTMNTIITTPDAVIYQKTTGDRIGSARTRAKHAGTRGGEAASGD